MRDPSADSRNDSGTLESSIFVTGALTTDLSGQRVILGGGTFVIPFVQRVADESENSLTGQGLILDTFQIQDVTDDGSYLSDLGRPEAARIQQAASIAEANARQAAEQPGSRRRRRSRSLSVRSP